MVNHLIAPHGGALIDLMVDSKRAHELKAASVEWPSWDLTPRQLCDLELLMNGGFSPLTTFMGRADYESVRDRMRLADGTLWPIPVTLDVSDDIAAKLAPGGRLSLRDAEGVMLAALEVAEVWEPDREAEAAAVLGMTDPQAAAVSARAAANPQYADRRQRSVFRQRTERPYPRRDGANPSPRNQRCNARAPLP